MKERIAAICSHLSYAEVFADIGCDHGYMTEYMLGHHLAERAYISDISADSLKKAERLLAAYIRDGRCIPVVADGLDGIPEPCGLVLIAGMGGEEIISILRRRTLPERFVLQPMKNGEKVRRFLVESGAHIQCDETFSEGNVRVKYYDLIAGERTGGDTYSELQFRYGRDNLLTPGVAFLSQMRTEAGKLKERIARPGIKETARVALMEKLNEIRGILYEAERTL